MNLKRLILITLILVGLSVPIAYATDQVKFSNPPTETEIKNFLAHPPDSLPDNYAPFDTLNTIACWASEHAPKDVIEIFIRKWGGRMSPVCQKWLISEQVPALKPLLSEYIKLSGVNTGFCGGSYPQDVNASWILQQWALAMDSQPASDEEIKQAVLRFPVSFEHWAQQGLWEKEEYSQTWNLLGKMVSPLEIYYKRHFKMTAKFSHQLAIYNLNSLAKEYLDRAPSNPRSFANSYESGSLNTDDVLKFLKAPSLYRKKYSQASIDSLLKLAIVNDFSLPDIRIILENLSPPVPVHQETALMKAANRPDVLKALLKTGYWNVDEQNWFGKTAIMYAIQYNNLSSVNLLLTYKADPNLATFTLDKISQPNCGGDLKAGLRTPLMYAAWHATPEIMERLIEAGADKNLSDNHQDNNRTSIDESKEMHTAKNYLVLNIGLSEARRVKAVQLFSK